MADRDTWSKAVGAVLAKAKGVSADELGEAPERLLAATTEDGISIAPLATLADETAEQPLPGTFPFTRGADGTRDVRTGWLVAERFTAADFDQPESGPGTILAALEAGTSAVWLAADSVVDGLAGILLDLAPVLVTAGNAASRVAEEIFAELDRQAAAATFTPTAVRINLGAAPLTSAISGRADLAIDDAIELALACDARGEDVRAFIVDGWDLHNAGATTAQELGYAAAAGAEYVRALTARGLTADAALRQVGFRLAATDDQFETIAKFRAWRTVWARIAEVAGAPDAGAAPVHAVTSLAMSSQRDPWVNMLRTTLASLGAGVGGADYVTSLPYDAALPASASAMSKGFAARIARNTELLLLEESNIGRVLDPAGGSWHVETLTADLARAAWANVQAVERDGGLHAATQAGTVAAALEESARTRATAVARRKKKLTGVNEFANVAEPPLTEAAVSGFIPELGAPTLRRWAVPFESLRDRSDAYLAKHGARPQVQLVTIGTVAQHNARSTFVANLLAAGGVEAVVPVPDSAGSVVAVVAGSDAGYAAEGAAAVAAARAGGARYVYLAGAPGAVDGTDGVDDYLNLKIDAVAALDTVLTTLGA